MQFDKATSRRVEATYTTPDVAGQRRVIRTALGLKPADDISAWASDLVGLGPGYFFSLNRYLFVAVRD